MSKNQFASSKILILQKKNLKQLKQNIICLILKKQKYKNYLILKKRK